MSNSGPRTTRDLPLLSLEFVPFLFLVFPPLSLSISVLGRSASAAPLTASRGRRGRFYSTHTLKRGAEMLSLLSSSTRAEGKVRKGCMRVRVIKREKGAIIRQVVCLFVKGDSLLDFLASLQAVKMAADSARFVLLRYPHAYYVRWRVVAYCIFQVCVSLSFLKREYTHERYYT